MHETGTIPTQEGLREPRRKIATLAILATMSLVVLDGAIANVALPSIASALQTSPEKTVWIVTAYQLALVMGILPSAALGESLGHRRIYVAGVVLFMTASILCATAPSLPWLITGRFLQGLGAAPLMALGTALLRFTYPPYLIGRAIGSISIVIALSAALGPTVGASILSLASWPWIFTVNIPIGLTVLIASRALPKTQNSGRALDIISTILNASAFATLVIGAGQALKYPQLGLSLLSLSFLCFWGLFRREISREAPLFPLDLLRERSFRISIIASVCCFTGQMTSYVALPFLFQHEFHQSVLATGFALMSWPLMVAIAGAKAGKLVDKGISGGLLCAIGGALLAIGLGLIAIWPRSWGILPVILSMMICGIGFGLFQVPNNRNMLVSAPKARSGTAGGMQGTARLTGHTLGGLLMSILFSLQISSDITLRIGLGGAAGLTLLGGLVSLMHARTR